MERGILAVYSKRILIQTTYNYLARCLTFLTSELDSPGFRVAQKVGCKSRALKKQEAVRVYLYTVCNQIIALITTRFFGL
jgi:hypothetical protein